MKKIVLKKSGEDKINYFRQWIYYNEINKIPKGIKSGEIVEIFSQNGKFLGIGYINPLSKISLRVLSFFKRINIDDFIKKRIKNAIYRRKGLERITNAYRVVHSEADFLPGLIVDKYDKYISFQINTAGMENFRDKIIDSLVEIFLPKGVYDKSDRKIRKIEGLDTKNKVVYGIVPENLVIVENEVKFSVYLKEGQKTGFYLDQRKNRKIISEYVKSGDKILDLFSNSGGFGIYAGKRGSEYIKFVDISENALNQVEYNCKINQIKNYAIVKKDVFDFLKKEIATGRTYNLIIIDPPSFAKTKHEKEGALRGFKYLLINGLKLLEKDGYLAVFSCSYHVDLEDLMNVLMQAARDTQNLIEILEILKQDKDHPIAANMPESFYLKGLLVRKL